MPEIDSIIQKYLQGQTTEEENQLLYIWSGQSPENKKRLFAEKDVWDSYGLRSDQKGYEIAPELELVRKRIEIERPQGSIMVRQILQMAAMLLITFGLGWASQFIAFTDKLQSGQVTMQEIFVPKGQVNQVFL